MSRHSLGPDSNIHEQSITHVSHRRHHSRTNDVEIGAHSQNSLGGGAQRRYSAAVDLDAVAFSQRWVHAWNAHDVEAVLRQFHDDVVFTSPLAAKLLPETAGVLRGKAELRRYWDLALQRIPDLQFVVEAVYEGIDTVVITYRNQDDALVNEVLRFSNNLVIDGCGTYSVASPIGPDTSAPTVDFVEDWSTLTGLHAIRRVRSSQISGWQSPAAYAVGYASGSEWVFPHINAPGGSHELPAVILAEILGYSSGTREFHLSSRQLEEAIAALSPAEAATDVDHPNLASWRKVAARRPREIVAVFIGAMDDESAGPADNALRAALTSS